MGYYRLCLAVNYFQNIGSNTDKPKHCLIKCHLSLINPLKGLSIFHQTTTTHFLD